MPKPSIKPPPIADLERTPTLRTKGAPFRHIVAAAKLGDRRWFLHATKGWRTEVIR